MYFENFYANTLAGTGCQSYFTPRDKTGHRGLIFYKIFAGGEYAYSLYFSNAVDSTFSDGTYTHKNMPGGEWVIHSLRAGVCSSPDPEYLDFARMEQIFFTGQKTKTVAPGETFSTDPITLSPAAGEYFAMEIVFSGEHIPNHPESMTPAFVCIDGLWIPGTEIPFPSVVGCDRPIRRKIAFLGDSITQGIGVGPDSYLFWDALLAEQLGHENGYWNLGLGFARGDDAASDGVWLAKARQGEYVFVCFGVNDIHRGFSAEQIKCSLQKIVTLLHQAGCRVLVQTVPVTDDKEEKFLEIRSEVNRFIMENQALGADCVFDCSPYLTADGSCNPPTGTGNVHPNAVYCKKWADGLLQLAREFIDLPLTT